MFDIITIGSATRDVFLTSPLFRILRDLKHLSKIGFKTGEAQCFALGLKIEIGPPILTTGGGATNAATSFSRQGLKTATLIKIGKDESGEAVLNELKKEKIAPFAVVENNFPTAYSTILLAPSGERTILVYRGASENLKIQEIPFEKLKSQWVYISPGKISFEVIEKIFNHFSKNKTLIAFNPSGYFIEMGIKKLKPLLAKSKVVILNREEAARLTGVDYQKEKEIFKKLDEFTPGIAAMTDAEKGVLVSDGFRIYQAGIFKEKSVIDRTGAGDAFASGFVAGLIQKKEKCEKGLCRPYNIEYAIRLGSANATSVIEKIGVKDGILTKMEFENNKRWKNLQIKIL
ncbi:MAG: carbohydrate kinase family protein [bacterium]|nr:carbohydrate kinase family protein [bacterium]